MKRTRIFRYCLSMLLVTAIALLAVSCHSHRAIITGPDGSGKGGMTVDKKWSSLDITLDRHDNKRLYREIKSWLGAPYLYGGRSRKGTDCSGFVMEIYKKVYHIDIERNSAKIFEENCKRIRLSQLREGDLVFFNTSNDPNRGINHVAIYLKENKIAHATSSRGVMISDMRQKFWTQHCLFGGRVTTH